MTGQLEIPVPFSGFVKPDGTLNDHGKYLQDTAWAYLPMDGVMPCVLRDNYARAYAADLLDAAQMSYLEPGQECPESKWRDGVGKLSICLSEAQIGWMRKRVDPDILTRIMNDRRTSISYYERWATDIYFETLGSLNGAVLDGVEARGMLLEAMCWTHQRSTPCDFRRPGAINALEEALDWVRPSADTIRAWLEDDPDFDGSEPDVAEPAEDYQPYERYCDTGVGAPRNHYNPLNGLSE